MTSVSELYAALKGDVVAVADPLFDHCQQGLRSRGAFLPQAAALTSQGRVTLIGAMTGSKDGFAHAAQVITMLHRGLWQMSREKDLIAVGIAESYSGVRAEQPLRAIRVHFEHQRGLSVALFQPFEKNEFGVYSFGQSFVVPVAPEVKLWAGQG
jgi:hypothetical protein